MSLDENTPDARRFPIMGGRDRALKSVDWSVAEQAREQALTNHGQTLEQLAARGGLDAREGIHRADQRGGSLWVWLAADVLGNTSSRNHGAAAGCVTAGGSYSCSNK